MEHGQRNYALIEQQAEAQNEECVNGGTASLSIGPGRPNFAVQRPSPSRRTGHGAGSTLTKDCRRIRLPDNCVLHSYRYSVGAPGRPYLLKSKLSGKNAGLVCNSFFPDSRNKIDAEAKLASFVPFSSHSVAGLISIVSDNVSSRRVFRLRYLSVIALQFILLKPLPGRATRNGDEFRHLVVFS